jgi:putative PIG3 family NAD(P)H quinone oxidoreductase
MNPMLPKTNHVIEIRTPGSPEVLQWAERPMPQPAADEVLIKVVAAGLNRADILQRQGNYPPPEGAGDILGMEVAGEIAAIGAKVKRWTSGDKIGALISGGGYAEYAVAPEEQCLPVPKNISFVEAAALPEAVITVWANLFEAGNLRADQTALVHGGSSGIGTTAIQMAKSIGAKIFVTARNEEKCAACMKLGADLAINYKREDFVAVIEHATQKRGVDVVLDMVGGDYVARNLSILAPGGHHVSIAVQGGKNATIDLWQIMRKRLVLTGSTLRHRSRAEKARLVRAVEEKAWNWVAEGKVKPLIYKTFPIKNAAAAHKLMESGAHIGKIVLEVSPSDNK